MTEREPADIGGRYRLTPAQAAPPPLEPLAAVDVKTGAACEAWLVPPGHGGLDHSGQRQAAAGFTGLRHPSLQCLNGVFPGTGGLGACWVYEAPPGKSFEALAAEGRPFTEAEAADMAASLAGALKKLHGAYPGAAHGGICPGNLYLAENGRAVLCGVRPFEERAGKDGSYVPPEGVGSQQADIYSLGASLVFLLTGKKPQPGGAAGLFGDLDRSLPFSPEFTRRIKKMTAPVPAERYRSAAGLEADLAALLTGRPASRSGILVRAAVLCALLAAAAWGTRAFLSRGGAEEVLKGGKVGWAEPGGLAFSPDGGQLALAGDTGLYIWDTGNWRRERTGGFNNGRGTYTRSVAFLPGGGLAVGSSTGEGRSDLRLISSAAGNRSVLLKIELGKKLDSVAVSPDGGLLAAAVNGHDRTEQRYQGGEIKVFDAAGRAVHELRSGGGPVFSLTFTADGKGLVYKTYLWDTGAKAYNLGRIILRDLESGAESVLLEEKPGYGSGLFSYGRSGIAAVPVGSGEVLEIRQVPEGRLLATLNREAYKEKFRYMISSEGAFNGDGSLFAAPFTSGGAVYARLFGADGWRLLKTFRLGRADKGGIAALAFSPDGKRLAAAQGNAFGSRVYIFGLKELAR